MRKAITIIWVSLSAAMSLFGAQASFDPSQNQWVLSNGSVQAIFQLTANGNLLMQSLVDVQDGDVWGPAANQPSSPIRLQAGSDVFDANRAFVLLDQYTQTLTPSGLRQYIVLQDAQGAAQITLMLDLYDGWPVLRYSVSYRNLTGSQVYVTLADMLPWAFNDYGQYYTALRANQWSVSPFPEDFEQTESALDPAGTPFAVYSGAHASHCGWLAVRDSNSRGLFAGWEFDGKAKTTLTQQSDAGYLQLSSTVMFLHHPVQPMADFQLPFAFIGFFQGDFDEAGYRTQSFVEGVLAKPAPSATMFPYVAWDSWAYGEDINEDLLKQNAAAAAAVGAELFIVDLGWARSIGDWYEDPAKFPEGLLSVSDYVHSLGMKFGLHFALTEADPASPVLQANPDWTSTENDGYFGASSLCLSNQPTQDWLIQQGIRMIDDYNVDWILQDGENMVKQCTKTTHTHDPGDSNYSNAVNGIDVVVSAIQAARPNVSWENCEDGGNMMTFSMVSRYVTSITNDASGDLEARQAAYGATYPFSPRYAERYMIPSDSLDSYGTHSYMFGGNWVLMNQLATLGPDQLGYLAQEIATYKAVRGSVATGKVYHILPPSAGGIDVIESYSASQDNGLAVVTRADGGTPQYLFHPLGLNPNSRYTVTFDVSPTVYSLPGAQLMSNGVRVDLPAPYSSDIVYINHQ
jgi:hypothetical protein